MLVSELLNVCIPNNASKPTHVLDFRFDGLECNVVLCIVDLIEEAGSKKNLHT